MKVLLSAVLSSALFLSGSSPVAGGNASSSGPTPTIFGFRDATAETATEARFLAVPEAKLAEEHLRILTQAPHMAGTIEDKATAD